MATQTKLLSGSVRSVTTLLLLMATVVNTRPAAGPPGGVFAENPRRLQEVLIGPMEEGDPVGRGGWRMGNLRVEAAEGTESKVGRSALTFSGDAEIAGSKGDFTIHGELAGKAEALGLWIHLTQDANIGRVGVQVYDAESEALLMLVPADWRGWKWVEFTTAGEHVRQAYPQAEKNARIDQPLKSQNVVWFAKAPGATRITADGMVALVDRNELDAEPKVAFSLSAPSIVQPGRPLPVGVLAVNYTDQPASVNVAYSLQRDSALYATPLPDPIQGSNHASRRESWTIADGEMIEKGSLTDGLPWTDAGTDYKTDHFTEAFQYVELDKVRRITRMSWLAGDANHTWLVDVSASRDGEEFTPVKGLQNVDQHKKWGWQDYPLPSRFEAKRIRFHYHTGDPRKKVSHIRFPCELALYDGVADENVALPSVGAVLEEGRVQATVPARSFRLFDLPVALSLDAGAAFLGMDAVWSGRRTLAYGHLFAVPQADASLASADSRFGLNCAHGPLAPRLRDSGIGWVRFENMKWPFVSPRPRQYRFDGSVGPWHVNTDEIFQAYRQNGLNVLTYMFLTPQWASSAPPGAKPDRVITFPPKDPALFGEFCFQTAARYGNTRHPAGVLFSNDKKSGLGRVHYYEMWNEPGLNPKPDATWGGWSASLDEYYRMMRYGAEAIKRADPSARVTSAGYAGIQVETVDRLRSYKYPDGKCPLDFVEVINVHYYSGQNPPETATEDVNTQVSGRTTLRQDLEELAGWRDQHAPGMPIWVTETGYDSAGPFGTTEAVQAARLPRVVMLCLAFGVDKVFVYRESGSTPAKHACSGLLRDDFSEKPSWFTFATLVRQFAEVQGGAERLPHPDERVWLLKWDAAGEPLLTAWTVEGRARLGIDLGKCQITDAFGARLDVKNMAELELAPFPMYIRKISASAEWRELLKAHEARQRELQKRRERARACRKYLYDFGSADRVGAYLLAGIKFPYTPVRAADVWEEARGYGFNTQALGDENRPWDRSKLDGDGCRMRDGLQFRFRAEPGAYHLTVGFRAHADQATLLVEGLSEPLTLPLSKRDALAETDLTLAGPAVLSVSHRGYGEIRWLSLVEKE